jgi:hypothetical protein
MGPPRLLRPEFAGSEINAAVEASRGRVLEAYSYR